MNSHLTGYEIRVGGARFQPLGFSITLRDVVLRQSAHREPAVLVIPRLHASVHWKELLFLRVVADFAIDRPRAWIHLAQLRSELSDEIPAGRKGWQEAVEAIYPLKINLLRIRDGSLTYVDRDPEHPLEVSRVALRASNIRNIHSQERTYPSPVEASAVVFRTGRASFEGHADFLAEPYVGVRGRLALDAIPLDPFHSVVDHWNVLVAGGSLTAHGELEFAPGVRRLILPELVVSGVRIGYEKRRPGAQEHGLAPAAAAPPRREGRVPWELRLARFRLVDSRLELRDTSREPDYRLFVDRADATVEGLDTLPPGRTAHATLTGRFQGSGKVEADGTFRPTRGSPDLKLKVAVGPTPMTDLNGLFRAFGKFDVAGGTFQLYSEIDVHEAHLKGYVKPIFKDVDVYDSRQEKGKGFLRKAYERIVDIASDVLKNRERDQVATNATIEGPVGDAHSSFFDVLGGVLENAFVRAILPGFDRQVKARNGG